MFLTRLLRNSLGKRCRLFSSDAGNTNAESDVILTKEVNDRGVIILNRPHMLNAVNIEMAHKLLKLLLKWQDTKSLVIVKGAGEKALSSGADLKTAYEKSSDFKSIVLSAHMTNYLINTYKIPYVAIMDGVTMGGGVGISVHGSYRIATERTQLSMPETIVGLIPNVGGTYFLPRIRNKLGIYMGLTGSKIVGKDVLKLGLATHYCTSSKLDELENAMLAIKNPNEVDRILHRHCTSDDLSPVSFGHRVEQVNNCFNATSVEEILRNLERDGTEWAQKTIEKLRKMPPTGLKVSLRALNLGARQTLAQCLQTETRLMLRLAAENDFQEGVRSLLIEKTNNPKWNPATIEEVSEQRVLSFFEPLGDDTDLPVEKQLAAYSKQ